MAKKTKHKTEAHGPHQKKKKKQNKNKKQKDGVLKLYR